MKQHRRHWSRGAWPRKTTPSEAVDSSFLFKSLPMRDVVNDESGTWTEIAREESASCWDSRTLDVSFFDDNKKVFEWDDSGAVDYLKKAEVKLQRGINSVYADYLNDSNQFSASINWDERRLCTLPDCAEDVVNRDAKRKNPKGSSARRDPSDSAAPVVVGLPEPQNVTGCYTPSLQLPLHFVPFPTGWDDGEDNPVDARWEDSPMRPLTATYPEETEVRPTCQTCWQTPKNSNEVSKIPGSMWLEYPRSYPHIIPSGWEDVEVDQRGVPSSRGAVDRESRSDIQTHNADMRGCDYPSSSSRPALGNPHASAESHPVYRKAHSGKQQDLYYESRKYGYWRPKRGSETNTHESIALRSMRRPGRSISTIHRVNQDPICPHVNQAECSKAQWLSVDTPTQVSS